MVAVSLGTGQTLVTTQAHFMDQGKSWNDIQLFLLVDDQHFREHAFFFFPVKVAFSYHEQQMAFLTHSPLSLQNELINLLVAFLKILSSESCPVFFPDYWVNISSLCSLSKFSSILLSPGKDSCMSRQATWKVLLRRRLGWSPAPFHSWLFFVFLVFPAPW